jgi:hypothetical protein
MTETAPYLAGLDFTFVMSAAVGVTQEAKGEGTWRQRWKESSRGGFC